MGFKQLSTMIEDSIALIECSKPIFNITFAYDDDKSRVCIKPVCDMQNKDLQHNTPFDKLIYDISYEQLSMKTGSISYVRYVGEGTVRSALRKAMVGIFIASTKGSKYKNYRQSKFYRWLKNIRSNDSPLSIEIDAGFVVDSNYVETDFVKLVSIDHINNAAEILEKMKDKYEKK